MDNKPENSQEKKTVGKAKSYASGPALKVRRTEEATRKAFSVNEAVMSLDLALGRLKKSKLVPGDSGVAPSDILLDVSSPSSNINPGLTNASLMSMNFSHYELIRNLSRSTSNSEGAFSGATCNTSSADPSLKDEHLEKYFRSVEMWHRKHQRGGGGGGAGTGTSVQFEVPDKTINELGAEDTLAPSTSQSKC